jgi:hypothetical protein
LLATGRLSKNIHAYHSVEETMLLEKMQSFFYQGKGEERKRRTFAICGLGMLN